MSYVFHVPADFTICPSWLTYGSIILVVAAAVPIVLYLTVFVDNPDFEAAMWTCALKPSYRYVIEVELIKS